MQLVGRCYNHWIALAKFHRESNGVTQSAVDLRDWQQFLQHTAKASGIARSGNHELNHVGNPALARINFVNTAINIDSAVTASTG